MPSPPLHAPRCAGIAAAGVLLLGSFPWVGLVATEFDA